MNPILFKYSNGLIDADSFKDKLRRLEVDNCDVLYIHSGMQFGLPNLQLGRSGVLETIANVLYELDVPTLIMPSYTFSFCNDQVFDREHSTSSMGALNEFMRIKHKWIRSCDPLMSNIIYGKEHGLLTKIGKQSVGVNSTFDLLSRSGLVVKFLFLGPRIHECFTYMHYLEAVKQVPYRYDFTFYGSIIDGKRQYFDKYSLFIRDENVKPSGGAKVYENMLIERGLALFEKLGGGSITGVDLVSASSLYFDLLELSPNFYIEEVFEKPIRPSIFSSRKMVSL